MAWWRRLAIAGFGFPVLATPATAHAGALGGRGDPGPIPLWLIILTGGALVAASFLTTAFVTNRRDLEAIAGLRTWIPLPATLPTVGRRFGGLVGVGGLLLIVASALVGPTDPAANLAVLVVWAAWWAGFTMSVYLIGNTWPALNPWRHIAGLLPHREGTYPERWGVWPAVIGLLVMVALEVLSPVATDPRLLGGVVIAYTAITLVGAAAVGPRAWFGNVDPIARVFAAYGRLAPLAVTRQDGRVGLVVGFPGVRLCRPDRALRVDETAFVVALLWVTTYDGLVSTPAWNAIARPVVRAGLPAPVLYLVAIGLGFAVFLAVYRWATRYARRTAASYVTAKHIGGWFAGSLLPIAAGYHLAHFLGYLIRLTPALIDALASPLVAPATVTVAVIPGWFGALQLLFVIGGHLLAVWIAHIAAFELFPGSLAPLRSQYPLIIVMIGYTLFSMWIVAQPYAAPAYV